jgi:hypothetical protein
MIPKPARTGMKRPQCSRCAIATRFNLNFGIPIPVFFLPNQRPSLSKKNFYLPSNTCFKEKKQVFPSKDKSGKQ